jgi:DNA replication protein DnaC
MEPGESLALFGSVGTGKTHLAIVTCQELIKRHLVFAKYMPVLEMFEMARQSFDNEMANPIPAIKKCDFLVLDDLGSERPTPWVLEQLTSIIDHRVANRLPFLITSNAKNWVGLCQMLTQLSDGDDQVKLSVQRIVDRFTQVIREPIVMVGSSWRSRLIRRSRQA